MMGGKGGEQGGGAPLGGGEGQGQGGQPAGVDAGAAGDALDPRAIGEEREDDTADVAGELREEVSRLTELVGALERERDEARSRAEEAARSREIGLLLRDRGAVDLEAVEAVVVSRLDGDASLSVLEAVDAVRAERPALFGPDRAAAGGVWPEWSGGDVGRVGSAMSARVPAAVGPDVHELADRARERARDRRALLRYLRARRGAD